MCCRAVKLDRFEDAEEFGCLARGEEGENLKRAQSWDI